MLFLSLLEDKLADGVAILIEVVLACVVTLEFDLIDHVLRGLLKCQIFDKVLEAQTMLLVIRSFLDLLIDLLLPGDVLSVGHLLLLQDGRHGAHHVWIELSRWVEAFRFEVDLHPAQWISGHLGWLLAWNLLGLLLHVNLRHSDIRVLRHLVLVLGRRVYWLRQSSLGFFVKDRRSTARHIHVLVAFERSRSYR